MVEGLGHCGDRHTPRSLAQALDNGHKFKGEAIDGWRAYNITADPLGPGRVERFGNHRIFEHRSRRHCASCHGWSGVSSLTGYATLTGSRAVNDGSGVNLAMIVLAGERRPNVAGAVTMPAFGAAYSDTEIAAVANYVSARFGAAPARVSPSSIAQLRRVSSK